MALALVLKVKTLALALVLKVKTLALALILKVKTLALVLKVNSWSLTVRLCGSITGHGGTNDFLGQE